LYALCFFNSSKKNFVISTAILSTLSSSFQNIGKSHSISKSFAILFSSLIALTFAYFIADKLSAIIESQAAQ
jgi:hypothetical protein